LCYDEKHAQPEENIMQGFDFATETITGWQGETFALRWRIPAQPGPWAGQG